MISTNKSDVNYHSCLLQHRPTRIHLNHNKTTAKVGFADKPDLGFWAFADAAIARVCGILVAEVRRTSPDRPFAAVVLVLFE